MTRDSVAQSTAIQCSESVSSLADADVRAGG